MLAGHNRSALFFVIFYASGVIEANQNDRYNKTIIKFPIEKGAKEEIILWST